MCDSALSTIDKSSEDDGDMTKLSALTLVRKNSISSFASTGILPLMLNGIAFAMSNLAMLSL